MLLALSWLRNEPEEGCSSSIPKTKEMRRDEGGDGDLSSDGASGIGSARGRSTGTN